MLSTTSKAKAGAKTARAIAESSLLRNAVSEAGPPIAKLGVKAGKRRVSRKTRKQLEHLGETVGAVAQVASSYAPQAAHAAQEFGLIEAPKRKRTAPRVVVGVVIGAATVYLLEPGVGREHRRQLQRLFGQVQGAAG